eukprot:scaffold142291_cov34-Prasinocladus_malaysianus.AAC.1
MAITHIYAAGHHQHRQAGHSRHAHHGRQHHHGSGGGMPAADDARGRQAAVLLHWDGRPVRLAAHRMAPEAPQKPRPGPAEDHWGPQGGPAEHHGGRGRNHGRRRTPSRPQKNTKDCQYYYGMNNLFGQTNISGTSSSDVTSLLEIFV